VYKRQEVVLEAIKKHLKEGPKYFEDDAYTDQPEMTIASEMIREAILFLLHDEIPHGVGVDVRSMQYKRSGTCEIHADILCSKTSHKGMIIGKQGTMLKHIGSRARQSIENMVGTKVNLKLWVRVKENWQNNSGVMKELGYHNE
jgi:GTP-binding protein Era